MGPSNRRTTSISAAKLRSLRIMLLSRSRRHKTRNNFTTTTTTTTTTPKLANKINNNNNCNTNHNAIAATTKTATMPTTAGATNHVKSYNKKFNARSALNVNKMYTSRMRLLAQRDEEEAATERQLVEDEEDDEDEEEEEEEDEEEEEEEHLVVSAQQETKMLEPKLENVETPAMPTIPATTNTAMQQQTPTISLTTPTHNQASEKVFYDNRIKRKNVLALNEKVAAIREYEKMPVYKRIGRMFQCSPDQIKRIVQQKESILKAWEQRTRRCQDAKTLEMKVVRVSMLGKAVYDWIRRMMYYKDFMITDGLIQKMALQFKSAMGLQNFFPHQDWCDKFRQTYKISEHDSKLLHIGYTQGHSVQIKDIIKDVLSECTPDLRTCETMPAESEVLTAPKTKTSKLLPKGFKQERKTEEVASVSSTLATNGSNNTNTKPTVRHLQLPQLVTLPRGLGNMPQKILVATPISNATPVTVATTSTPMTMTIIPLATLSSANSLIAANTKRVGRIVPPPMVEIKREIKEERRDEDEEQQPPPPPPQPQPQTQTQLLATKPIETTATKTATTTPTTTTIKEEIISDDEDAEDAASKACNLLNTSAQNIEPATMPQNLQQRTTSVRSREHIKMPLHRLPSPAAEGDDTMDSMDYENLALSSLKKIMQNKAAANDKICIPTTTTTPTTARLVATTTAPTTTISKPTLAKMSMRNTPTLTLTPIENLRATSVPLPPMVALSQLARVPITNTNGQLPPMPPLQLLPPLTKAPAKHLTHNANSQQQPLPALIPRAYATNVIQPTQAVASGGGVAAGAGAGTCTPLYSLGYRLPQKRKLYDDSVPLSPIKSCSEARRYLKLLEDFALFRENYRLIGLITRADEVLRELDGDDDVDVD